MNTTPVASVKRIFMTYQNHFLHKFSRRSVDNAVNSTKKSGPGFIVKHNHHRGGRK